MADIGSGSDAVKIVFAGKETRIFTRYSVRKSILTQPSQFEVTMGWGSVAADLVVPGPGRTPIAPPRTPFQLYVNEILQQTGVTDGFELNGFASEASIFGRDQMQFPHDGYVTEELSFQDATYLSLTKKVLAAAGLPNAKIVSSNSANRRITTGVGIKETAPAPATIDQIEPETDLPGNATVRRAIQSKVGEQHLEFLMRQLRRAGLFLWAAGDGSFVLSEPNKNQRPVGRIVLDRQSTPKRASRTRGRFRIDTSHRFSTAIVYGRGGGRKFGRAKSKGDFVDDEMVNEPYNLQRPIVYRDVNVSTREQAEFYSRRKLAEYARAGWQLQYTVPGHTFIPIGGGKPAVWQPDTMVEIMDDDYGVRGVFWIEEVLFTQPPTETTITVMRPEHLIFASDED